MVENSSQYLLDPLNDRVVNSVQRPPRFPLGKTELFTIPKGNSNPRINKLSTGLLRRK